MPAILKISPDNFAPFYKVISDNKELDCIPGSNNVFSAILLFLYMLKKKNTKGMPRINGILANIFRNNE